MGERERFIDRKGQRKKTDRSGTTIRTKAQEPLTRRKNKLLNGGKYGNNQIAAEGTLW